MTDIHHTDNQTFSEMLRATMKSKDTEEWIDVYFTRPIGLFFALIWRRLGVYPNAITVLSIFLGLAAAVMFYFEDTWHNVAGILLLMTANFCDSTDGQLARLTGKTSLVGRLLDGLAGDVWFAAIYVALCLRLMPQLMPGTDIHWGLGIWALAFVAGIICHSPQASLADYYRQVHLLFLKGRKGSELDHSEQQQAIYEALPKKGATLERLFHRNYANYCRSQERRTPAFQKLMAYINRHYGGVDQMPQQRRQWFVEQSRPLMKYTNILSFNVRAICLYVTCLLHCPWVYFLFEITVLMCLYIYMHRRHEDICKTLLDELQDDEGEVAVVMDYGATLDTGGQHWARMMWHAYQQHVTSLTWQQFQTVYVQAERAIDYSGAIKSHHTFRQTLALRIDEQCRIMAAEQLMDDSLRKTVAEAVTDSLYAQALEHTRRSAEVIRELKTRCRLALVSNFYGNLEVVLAEMGLDGIFDTVVESAKVGIRKPDRRLWQTAMDRLQVKAAQTWVVGDSLDKDIAPAQALHCHTVWMKGEGWNDDDGKHDGVTPDHTITDIRELLHLIPVKKERAAADEKQIDVANN